MITMPLFFLLIVVLTAYLAAAEMAFVSCSQLKMREKADKGDDQARKILRLQEDPQNFLSTLLISNNICNIAATALFTYFCQVYLKLENEWIITAVLAPFLIILSEMVPKDFGRMRSEFFLLQQATVLSWLDAVFRTPVDLVLRGVQMMLGRFKVNMDKSIVVSEKEFRMLIEESSRSGVLEVHEKQLINTILDFERIRLNSVMTPLNQVAMAEIGATVRDIRNLARKTGNKMVLVYEEVPSIVVGIVYIYDLLFESDETKGLKQFLRAPIFLPVSSSIEKAFLALQQKRQSYAVVMNDVSDAVGVVPIEKLIEF